MNIRNFQPKQVEVRAFQVEYQNMYEVVDYMNSRHGDKWTFGVVSNRFIAYESYGGQSGLIVNGDWIILKGDKFEVLSVAEFRDTYQEVCG